MPIIKSAKKRVRVAKRATTRNVKTKRSFRSAIKDFYTSLGKDGKASAKSGDALQQAQSELDTAVKKGVLHKNTASRKKKQLAAQAKKSGVKPATKAKVSTAKKAPAKKTATKKPATKKTATSKKSNIKAK